MPDRTRVRDCRRMKSHRATVAEDVYQALPLSDHHLRAVTEVANLGRLFVRPKVADESSLERTT